MTIRRINISSDMEFLCCQKVKHDVLLIYYFITAVL